MAAITIEYGAVESLDAHRDYDLAAASPGSTTAPWAAVTVSLVRRHDATPPRLGGCACATCEAGRAVGATPWWDCLIDGQEVRLTESELLRRVNLARALAAIGAATWMVQRPSAHPSGSAVLWEGVGTVRVTS